MKTPIKYLVVALSAALFSLPALRADDPAAGGPPEGRRGERREKMGDRMGDELGLSEDQKAQMKQLREQERSELQALGPRENMSDENRAKAQAIRKSYMEKRQALMTPEQREKAKAMREKGAKRMEERRGEGGPGKPGKHGEPK
jgi:periplasmic protein CpxP/Spy